MADINWKSKYTELKSRYMSAVDTAFRLGIEQGIQQSQQQQMQAQQQQQAEAEAAQQGQQPGQEGAPQEGDPAQDSAHPQGSELDQHISELESMLGKSEFTGDDLESLRKSFEAVKFGIEMKKSNLAIKGITKALKAPAKMSQTASHNLNPASKAALSMQQKIVSDIMNAWDTQEVKIKKSIASIVAGEGFKKD